MSSAAAKAGASGDSDTRDERASRSDTGIPGIIVVMREGETAFPAGAYAKVLDGKGSAAHTLKTISFFPGLNFTAKITIDRKREKLDEEGWEKIAKHPQFERLCDQHRIRPYKRLADIPSADRVAIAAITVDWMVLEMWFAAEADKRVKSALAEQMEKLRRQGLDKDDTHVAEVQTTEGAATTF